MVRAPSSVPESESDGSGDVSKRRRSVTQTVGRNWIYGTVGAVVIGAAIYGIAKLVLASNQPTPGAYIPGAT